MNTKKITYSPFFAAWFLLASQNSFADVPSDSSVAPLFDVFDQMMINSANSQGSSTLNMIDEGDNWVMGTEWTPQERYDETDVFHVELQHRSSGQNWDIRIGKGGQLYSWNVEGAGELIPPQGHSNGSSPWVDDVFLQTWRDSASFDEDATLGDIRFGYANTFVHGAGMYIAEEMDPILNKPFYNPMFAQNFNSSDRSYMCLNWGLIPTPSINRSDLLLYTSYKHLGNGTLEIIYYGYNFGNDTYDDNTFPWSMVRDSEFPHVIRSLPSGSGYERWYEGEEAYPKRFNLRDQGGWIAKTGSSNSSLTISQVHGLDQHFGSSWQSRASWCSSGISGVQNTTRDISITTAANNSIEVKPGEGFYKRFYLVLGEQSSVSAQSYSLVDNVDYGFVEFNESTTELFPLYASTLSGQNILTNSQPSDGATPVGYTYALPVKNSVPLFLMRDNSDGFYYLSTDQYALCGKVDFDHPDYQGRHIYQPYDDNTEWVAMLGYVMPASQATVTANTAALSTITNGVYRYTAGEKYTAGSLLIRTDGDTGGSGTTGGGGVSEIVYQAEDAAISNGSTKSNSDASENLYVDGEAGFNLTFSINAEGGETELAFRIKSPSGTRAMGVYANGVKVGTITALLGSWDTEFVTATLSSGNNIIELRDSQGTAELDVDYMTATFSSSVDGVYEAEQASVTSGVQKTDSEASSGFYIDGSNAFNLSFTVDGSIAASSELTFRIKSPSGTRSMGVYVNGSKVGSVTTLLSFWNTKSVTAFLNSGSNIIELRDSEGTAELDVDYLEILMTSSSLTAVSNPIVTLRKRNNLSYALDGNHGGEDGQNLYLWSYSVTNINQQWEELDRGNGYYSYQKVGTNYSIDGGNGGDLDQNVYLWTTDANNYNQHWRKIDMGNGYYRLEKRNSSIYSIDGGSGGDDGQNVELWNSSSSSHNLQWLVK